jgi:hypothetical protein
MEVYRCQLSVVQKQPNPCLKCNVVFPGLFERVRRLIVKVRPWRHLHFGEESEHWPTQQRSNVLPQELPVPRIIGGLFPKKKQTSIETKFLKAWERFQIR